MASTDLELTDDKKNEILQQHASVVLQKIPVRPNLMSHLVEAGAIDALDSQDIQDMQTGSDKRNALLRHLMSCSVFQFIGLCEVLYDKEHRDDIVVKDFGLNMKALRDQKKQLLKEKEERNKMSDQGEEEVDAAAPVAHAEAPHRQEAPTAQHLPLTCNRDSVKDMAVSNSEYRPENTHVVKPPAVAANTQLSTSTFNEEMRNRLKIMNDALVSSGNPPRVIIAVLDTGMYTAHPRLQHHIKWSWTVIPGEEQDLRFDRANHGTISAGVIIDFVGMFVDIINIKVNNETSTLATLHTGFKYISEWENQFNQKVSIIVTSINASNIEPGLQDEFDTTLFNLSKNKVIICSAANKGAMNNDTVCYPGSESSVLAIGSLDQSGNRSGFSSRGRALDFMFQGEGFVSTSRPPMTEVECRQCLIYLNTPPLTTNDWVVSSAAGTSFAAPQCAAAIAVILSYTEQTLGDAYRQKLTRTDKMRKLLISVCEQKHDIEMGYGLPHLNKLNQEYIKDQVDKMYSL